MRPLRTRVQQALSSTSSSPPLPFEIISEVGEALTGNTKALRASSLVCRAWNSAIRPLIFRSVTLSQLNANGLEDLFESVPNIGFWIQEVRICGDRLLQRRHIQRYPSARPEYREFTTGSESEYEWFDKLPHILEVNLKRVHTFTFHHVQATVLDEMNNLINLAPLLANLPTVTSINLLGCRIHERSLKIVISSVPYLKNLHFHDCFFVEPPLLALPTEPDPGLLPHTKPQLSSLRIHSSLKMACQNAHFILIATERYTGSSDAMTTFHLHIDTPYHLAEFGQYIGRLGPQMQNLNLALPFVNYEPELERETDAVEAHFSLSKLTNLRSLHLYDVDHPAVPHLLSTIEAPHLDTIVFTIKATIIRNLKPHTFASIDEELGRPVFASLQKILFLYSGKLWEKTVSQKLKSLLPSIAERDIVRAIKNQSPRDDCPEREDVL